jgi:hypothetical protein
MSNILEDLKNVCDKLLGMFSVWVTFIGLLKLISVIEKSLSFIIQNIVVHFYFYHFVVASSVPINKRRRTINTSFLNANNMNTYSVFGTYILLSLL